MTIAADLACPCGHAELKAEPTTLMGQNFCGCCHVLSPRYDLFAACRLCLDDVCPACSAEERDDDETGSRTICRLCVEAA